MDRRTFLETAALGTGAFLVTGCLGEWEALFAGGMRDDSVGKALPKWRRGQFQVHFIYTGACESLFLVFPDGTSMLLDCGEMDTLGLGWRAVPRLPDHSRLAGEWIARYVERVNPHGRDVDYMMLSHYHCDHAGSETTYSFDKAGETLPYALSGFGEAARCAAGRIIRSRFPFWTMPKG